jgi:hypothetical protein
MDENNNRKGSLTTPYFERHQAGNRADWDAKALNAVIRANR